MCREVNEEGEKRRSRVISPVARKKPKQNTAMMDLCFLLPLTSMDFIHKSSLALRAKRFFLDVEREVRPDTFTVYGQQIANAAYT